MASAVLVSKVLHSALAVNRSTALTFASITASSSRMVNSRPRLAQLPWQHRYQSRSSLYQRHWPAKAQQVAFRLAAAPFPPTIAGPHPLSPGLNTTNSTFIAAVWGGYGSMHAPQHNWTAQLPIGCNQPPPPPYKASHRLGHTASGCSQSAAAVSRFSRMPLQAMQQQHHQHAAQKLQQHAAQKPKHRRSAGQRRRRAVSQKKQRLAKQQQHEHAIPQSPLCPPAPFNSNEYLMDRFEQQYAAQQADNAAAAQLAGAAAAKLEAVAEWDPSTQQASCPEPTGYSWVDEDAESPVCPPAPRLDNEFYMSRFEQQLKQEAAVAAAASAAAPIPDAGVAEWDPLLREVTTLQLSTASSLPAMCGFPDDSGSQC
jgi:hypothetical protein